MSLNGQDRKIVELRSEQGAVIRIGFYLTWLSNCLNLVASEILVTVVTPINKHVVGVTAVLINKYYNENDTQDSPMGCFAQENYQLPLRPVDSQTYDGALRDSVAARGYLNTYTPYVCRPEIAVVVDGEWQVDPVNKTHNFQFSWVD